MMGRLKNLYGLLMASFRADGVYRSLYWMVFGYVHKNEFVVFKTDTGGASRSAGDWRRLSVKIAEAEDLETIRGKEDFQTREAFIDRYRRVNSCLVGYYDGKPAHIMWIFRHGDYSRFFSLGQNEAEINFCYTAPAFRGKGIYSMMIGAALDLLKKQGVKTVYMATHSTNGPATKAISRAGFKRAGACSHYGIFYRPKWKEAVR